MHVFQGNYCVCIYIIHDTAKQYNTNNKSYALFIYFVYNLFFWFLICKFGCD